ncbi:methyl-accepting chemotaxis protein [Roseateles sp. BYS180W]|uniref:Methyl-accepting chemotaxis protein n=1 Tax=Roseateles rivi TaxID=3299028 RepID=A0ABW7FXE4_9BURK
MGLLSRLRIAQRLALSYGLLILLIICIGAYGAHNANQLSSDLRHTADTSLVKIHMTNELEAQVHVVAAAARDLLLLDEAKQIKKQRAAIDEALQVSRNKLQLLHEVPQSEQEEGLLKDVSGQLDAFNQAVSKFNSLQRDASPDEARESLISDLRPAQQKYQKALGQLIQHQVYVGSQTAKAGATLAQRSVLITAIWVGLAVLIGGGWGWTIARSIVLPVRQAKDAAQAISAGDLSWRIDAKGDDELAHMLKAMHEMQGALSLVVQQVGQAANEVADNSSDIANNNQDLSARTARSAASLQNTAASVEQIASNLAGASDLTRKAALIATKACQSASTGGTVVAEVVSTMEDISASSRRIGDIIGVIDGIAFQTNILALNAAVEAARAGEHGKGFAVVASEVRALASRSAQAAKEIKQLIQESTERVQSGTALVNNAGATIRSVVDEVNNMGQLIEEISNSAHEQAAGVGVVNNAMNELDRTTQQNTSLVDALSRSTEELRISSSRLQQAVKFFRVAA